MVLIEDKFYLRCSRDFLFFSKCLTKGLMKCGEQCHFHTPGDFQLMLRKFSLTVLLKSVVSISKQWQGETWRKDRDIFGSDSYGTSIFGLDLRFHLQFWINIVLLVNKSFQQIIQFLPTISSYCGLTLVTLFSTMLLLNFYFMDFLSLSTFVCSNGVLSLTLQDLTSQHATVEQQFSILPYHVEHSLLSVTSLAPGLMLVRIQVRLTFDTSNPIYLVFLYPCEMDIHKNVIQP